MHCPKKSPMWVSKNIFKAPFFSPKQDSARAICENINVSLLTFPYHWKTDLLKEQLFFYDAKNNYFSCFHLEFQLLGFPAKNVNSVWHFFWFHLQEELFNSFTEALKKFRNKGYIKIYFIKTCKLQCYTRISSPEKSCNNTCEKISEFFKCVWCCQSADDTLLAFCATRSGWWMNHKTLTILNPRSFECLIFFLIDYGDKTWKNLYCILKAILLSFTFLCFRKL